MSQSVQSAKPVAWFLALLLATIVLVHGDTLVAHAFGNAGMIAFRDALLAETARPDTSWRPGMYQLYKLLAEADNPRSTQMTQIENQKEKSMQSAKPVVRDPWFRHAVALDANNPTLRWELGRVALAAGDAVTAAGALRPVVPHAEHNPFLYQDALTAFTQAGMPAQAVALYESVPPPRRTQAISDTVALAYLNAGGQNVLEQVKQLRPGDLYANYRLWKEAQQSGDLASMATYRETLTYFPLEAISPTSERLLDYASQVIPDLLADGIWDRDKTLNVISYLVWQHNSAEGVEQVLKRLIERYPTEPDWLFYLAELYHRRGELDRAEAVYRQTLAADPAHAQAYLRLGMVAEAKSRIPNPKSQEQLERAAGWYEMYYEMAPDDLLGLKKLVEVCTALDKASVDGGSCHQAAEQVMGEQGDKGTGGQREGEKLYSPYSILREALEARTDDRRIVAELLGVPVEDVELGPNLVENGGFERWVDGRLEWWTWSAMFNREPFNEAAFVGGADGLLLFEGQWAARVDGFWIQHEEGKSAARAGFWQWDKDVHGLPLIPLMANTPYLLSFQYRTSRVPDDKTTVWVSSTDEPDVFWSGGDHGLPATGGAWHRFVVIGWNRSDVEVAIRPLIRFYAPGCAELENVQVRPIGLSEGIKLESREARFQAIGEND